MTDYFSGNQSSDETTFDAEYRQEEARFREEAGRFFEEHRQLVNEIRSQTDLDDAGREQAYIERYQELERRFDQRAGQFAEAQLLRFAEAKKKLEQGVGERFSDHLIAVSSMPDEGLERLLATAERTGEHDLARAVAQTALDRNLFNLFDRWANSNEGLAQSMKLTRTMPAPDRIVTRTFSARPPKVRSPEELKPRAEDLEKAAEEARIEEARRRGFFGKPAAPVPQPDPRSGLTFVGRRR